MNLKSALIASLVCLGISPVPASAGGIDMRMPAHRFMEFKLPAAEGSTHDLVAGPDRNLWVLQQNPARLLRVSPLGELAKLPLPKGSTPHSPVFDRAGTLWLAFKSRNTLAQVNIKTGMVTKEFSVTQPECPNVGPQSLALDADGITLWFVGANGNVLGKLNTTNGEVRHYPLPAEGGKPTVVSVDRSGNVWFNQTEGDRIGFLNTEGFMFDFPVPEGAAAPTQIVADPKEARMWFSLAKGGQFGHIDTTGAISVFPVPSANAKLAGLGFDRKGLLWLGYESPDMIAVASDPDSVKEYVLPSIDAKLRRILLGPDGNMWFIESATDKLGMVFDTADYAK